MAKQQKIFQAYQAGQKAWQNFWNGLIWEHEAANPYSVKADKLLYAAWRKGFEESRAISLKAA